MNITPNADRLCHGSVLGFNRTVTVQTILFLTITINCFGAIISVLQNLIVIWTLVKNSELHRPSFVLLGCLAMIDLLTGMITQPGWITYRLAEYYHQWKLSCNAFLAVKLSNVLISLSFGTLTIISIDRYLALHFHLRYDTLVTIPRLAVLIIIVTILAVLLLVPHLMHKYFIGTIVGMILIVISFATIVFCYCGIYKVTRQHQRQINSLRTSSERRTTHARMLKIKKSSMTFLLITILLLASVVPGLAFGVSYLFVGYNGFVVPFYDISTTLWLINGSVNPVIYFWRMKELRSAVESELRRLTQKIHRT